MGFMNHLQQRFLNIHIRGKDMKRKFVAFILVTMLMLQQIPAFANAGDAVVPDVPEEEQHTQEPKEVQSEKAPEQVQQEKEPARDAGDASSASNHGNTENGSQSYSSTLDTL